MPATNHPPKVSRKEMIEAWHGPFTVKQLSQMFNVTRKYINSHWYYLKQVNYLPDCDRPYCTERRGRGPSPGGIKKLVNPSPNVRLYEPSHIVKPRDYNEPVDGTTGCMSTEYRGHADWLLERLYDEFVSPRYDRIDVKAKTVVLLPND